MTDISDVPGTARPLHDALAAQGWTTLADLDGVPRTTVLNLHGVGKVGLGRLEEAMAAEGYALRGGQAVWTDTDRGEPKAGTGRTDNATVATGAEVIEFIDTVAKTAKAYADRGGDVEVTIRRKKRLTPPVPSPVTGEVEARLITLACSAPPPGYSRWSLRLLEKHVLLVDDIPDMDHSTIGRVLKKRNCVLI